MGSIHGGHRGRVKGEFLAQGLSVWPEHRVMELLLYYAIPQGDVNGLAHTLIDRFGSLAGALDAPFEELLRTPGVGEHTATLLKLIPAAGAAYVRSRGRVDTIVNCAADAFHLLNPYFFGARNELVYVLCLDGKDQVLGVRKVSEGSIRAADINLRRIMEEAVALRAARIYLAHNHVGSLALPSEMDWETTLTLYGALAGVGIELADHLVFQDDEMTSLRESQSGKIFLPL